MKRLLIPTLAIFVILSCMSMPAISQVPLATATVLPTLTSVKVVLPVSTPTQAPACLVVTASKSLNLRSGPSTSWPVSAWLDTGQEVRGIIMKADWYLVDTGKQTGYVHSHYVEACNVQSQSKLKRR